MTRIQRSRRIRSAVSAVLVGLIALLVCVPAFAAGWSMTLSEKPPAGWVEEAPIWADYQTWGWNSHREPDASNYELSAQAGVSGVLFPDTGEVTSPEAFVKQSNLFDMPLRDATLIDSGETTFGGYKAYFAKGTIDTVSTWDGNPKPDDTGYQEHYWVFLPDGKIMYVEGTALTSVELSGELPRYTSEMQKVLSLVEITQGSGAASGTTTTPPAWKTIAGGMAAVIAAGAALAGAAASRLGKRAKVDPKTPIGYVLQLSAEKLAVSSAASAEVTATVWRVLASGAVESAEGAQVMLHAPAGVSVSPASGASPLTASVWQTGDVVTGASLGVQASAPGGGTTATIPLDAEESSTLTLTVEPAAASIRPNGNDVAQLTATLRLSPGLLADPEFDAKAALAALAFSVTPADWVDRGELRDAPDGRTLPVAVSQPNPDQPTTPPETITVSATAQLPGRSLTQSITIAVERPPVIDIRPDTVAFAVGSKAREEVLAFVEPADQRQWAFSAAWKQGDRAVATSTVRTESSATAVVELTENAGALPPSPNPTEVSTLVVTAKHEDWGAIERHLKVAVSNEGLYVDATGQNPDGTFHLLADGTAKVTDIDVRVFARAETGEIAFSPELSRAVTFEVVSPETQPGGAAWRYGGVEHADGGMRPSNSPSAIHRFSIPRPLPTAGEPLRVELRAVSSGGPEALFAKPVAVSLLGVNTAPYSAAWETEKAKCLRIIDEYVPAEHRAKLTALVHDRGRTLGAEGLFAMRKQLWDFAYGQTMKEAHDHLTAAWWNEQIIDTLDWVSWCGDIALGAATGSLAGTAAAVGVGILKPSLVSAMQVWVDGGSISDWAYGQVAVFAGAIEGAATDVDAINKLAGNKALAWAVFISYTFIRELTRDPNLSVTEAMKRIAQQMRDEGLTAFLRLAIAKGGAKPAGQPAATKPSATKPAAKAAGAKDATGKKPEKSAADKDKDSRADHKPPVDSRAVKQLAERVKYRNGKPYADPRDVLAVMRDPEATRSLKNSSDPAIRDAFENTRQEIYAEHDRKLKDFVESRPDMAGKTIVVAEVRTPGKEAGFNTDRDFRVLVETTDPATGKTIYVEVPTNKWVGESSKIFAGETGGPTDPAGAKKWAEDHQQLGTDKWHAEAAPDMSDQKVVRDAEGNLVATQTEPRIAAVKDGRGTLIDPETLADVYEHKVTEQLERDHPGEAFAQASKAVRDLSEIREGYEKQQYDVGQLSDKMKLGMNIVTDAGTKGFDDPAAVASADSALKDAGFPEGLRGFMGALSAQVESLKYAKK
jgi:hypothetical protein